MKNPDPKAECVDILTHYLDKVKARKIESKTDIRMIVNDLRDLQMDLISVSWQDEHQLLQKFGVRI